MQAARLAFVNTVRTSRRSADDFSLYDLADPLGLLPFELRYLSRRQPPDRWVLDRCRDDNQLVLPPQRG